MLERVLQRSPLTTSVAAVVPAMVGTPLLTANNSAIRGRGKARRPAPAERGKKKGGLEDPGRGSTSAAASSPAYTCKYDATALLLSEKEVQEFRKYPSAASRLRAIEGGACLEGVSLPSSAMTGFHGFLGDQTWTSSSKPSAGSSATATPTPPTPVVPVTAAGKGKKGVSTSVVTGTAPMGVEAGSGGGGTDLAGSPAGVSSSTTTALHPTLLIGLTRRKAERAYLRRSTGAGVGLPPPASLQFTTPASRRKPLLFQQQSITISEYREAVTRAVRSAMAVGPQVETLRLQMPSSSVTVTSTVDLFHPTPYVFSAEELAEKTACFAVTGAYRYRRYKKEATKGSGKGEVDEEEDLWEQDDEEEEKVDVVGEALDRIGKRGVRAGRFLTTTSSSSSKTTTRGKSTGRRSLQKKKGRGRGRTTSRGKPRQGRSQKAKDATTPSGRGLQQVLIDTSLQEDVQTGSVIGAAVNEARDLGNLREDEGTPEFYIDWTLKQMEKKRLHGITVKKVLHGPAIEEAGMRMLYNVGRGSIHTPYVTVLEYVGDKKHPEATALVGKGVTFDCGGLNLKPYGSMETMHTDMMGAATVLTTLQAVAMLELPINIVAVVGLVENAIGPQSYHPGCILKSHKGLSVEVRNTDAEGRLVLADLFSYLYAQEEIGRPRSFSWKDGCGGAASKGSPHVTPRRHSFHLTKRPTSLIDLATLTGAIMISLGDHRAGCFSNDPGLSDSLMEAGTWCGEELWPMPIGVEHVRAVQGGIADLVNTPAGRLGGSCTAAAFLAHFVPSGVKWAHLDIAGPADVGDKGRGMVHPPGATGFGVQLLMDYLRRGKQPLQAN